MDTLQPYLDFFAAHIYLLVFVTSLVDATGFPFPGRIMLVVAGTLAGDQREVVTMVLLGAVGAVLGDHALYLVGVLGGSRLLSLYCRLTLSPPVASRRPSPTSGVSAPRRSCWADSPRAFASSRR